MDSVLTPTGVISGTPTKAANGGDAAFTVEASDGVTTVLDPVTLMIDPTLQYQPSKAKLAQHSVARLLMFQPIKPPLRRARLP